MEKKKWLKKLSFRILLVLILCTCLSMQIQKMLLPQVMTVPIEPGTVYHMKEYPAIAQGWTVSWTLDAAGYEYYGENPKAALNWMAPDGQRQTKMCRIKKKKENGDGSWTFTLHAKKAAGGEGNGLFGTISVTMENRISYPYTIPLSALSQNEDGAMVFVVRTTQGIFSDEQTVMDMPVKVLDRDEFTAAVTMKPKDRIVSYTSQPLAGRMRVIIAE